MAFSYARAAHYFVLADFIGGFRLGMKYFKYGVQAQRLTASEVLPCFNMARLPLTPVVLPPDPVAALCAWG